MHEMLEAFSELGVPAETLSAPVTWYEHQGVLHGSTICAQKALGGGYAYREEECTANRTERSVLDVTPGEACPECAKSGLARVGSGVHYACMLLSATLDLAEPLPESAQEILKERERKEYAWLPVHEVGDAPGLAEQHQDLVARRHAREAALERLLRSESVTEQLLSEVREALGGGTFEETWGTFVVQGKVHPLVADLYAALVERFRVAALHPEADEPWDTSAPDPTYAVQAPGYVLRYLAEHASWRKVVYHGDLLHPEASVVSTALQLWAGSVEGAFTSLEEAARAATILCETNAG